jgi:hypothetical protein
LPEDLHTLGSEPKFLGQAHRLDTSFHGAKHWIPDRVRDDD